MNKTVRPLSRRQALAMAGAAFWMTGRGLAATSAAAKAPLLYVDEDRRAPISQRLPDGEMVGLKVECVDLVTREAGIAIRHETYPWARAQRMVELGEADAFCTTPTNELLAFANFCRHPLIPVKTLAYYLKSSAHAERIGRAHQLEDLHGLAFVEYLGNSWASEALKQERVNQVNSGETAIRALESGRADVFVDSALATPSIIAKLGLLSAIGWVPVTTPYNQDYHFGVRRSLPEADTVIRACDTAIERLSARGELKRVLREYGIL